MIEIFKYIISYDGGQLRDSGDFEWGLFDSYGEAEEAANDAKEIAEEKLGYKWDQISMLEDRQAERYSVQREKLIRKLERSNPLRYIKNKEHAMAILEAGNRHTCTDYEKKLKVLHELEKEGFIEKGDAKEIARTQSMGNILNNINA